jgi:hypothetical protein
MRAYERDGSMDRWIDGWIGIDGSNPSKAGHEDLAPIRELVLCIIIEGVPVIRGGGIGAPMISNAGVGVCWLVSASEAARVARADGW